MCCSEKYAICPHHQPFALRMLLFEQSDKLIFRKFPKWAMKLFTGLQSNPPGQELLGKKY